MKSSERFAQYLPHVDGLRAIAVIAVVVFHLNPEWLPGGFSGVDVFFVISGFVVSASAHSRGGESFWAFLVAFISRRCARIVPALALVLVVTTLTSTLLIPDAWLSEDIHRTGRAATFGLANVFLASRTDNYFSPTTEFNPFVHTWSLGIEEQFYLLFPLFFWVWVSRKSCRGTLMSILLTTGLCSFACAWVAGSENDGRAFYLLECRVWELLTGVLLFQSTILMARWMSRFEGGVRQACKTVAATIGLLLTGYGLWTSTPTDFPAPGALWVVLGTSLLLLASCGATSAWPMRMLATRPVRWVGRLSYSLYLWHWPVFVLFRWTIGLEDWSHKAMATAIAIVAASLCWLCVERPLLRLSRERPGSHAKSMAWGFAALVAVGSWNGLLHHYRWSLSLSTVASHAIDWYPTMKGHVISGACSVPKPSITSLGEGRRITYTRNACDLPTDESTMFVVGDSHALAFGKMFGAHAARSGRRIVVYDNAGCGYLSLQPEREASSRCRSSSSLVTEEIVEKIRHGDVVFLPSLRMPRIADQWTRYPRDVVAMQALGAEASAKENGLIDAAIRVLSRFTEKGARVVLEAPNLLLNAPAYRCVDPWTQSNPVCAGGIGIGRAEFEGLRRPMFNAVETVARAVPGTTVFDPFPWLCPDGPICTGFRNGRPLFFDADHISGFGNDVLLPGFEAVVRPDVAHGEPDEAGPG